jgi:IS1 family transposase/transposase-like protein
VKSEELTCPQCGCCHIKKNGTTPQGKQRYRCKNPHCGKSFLFLLSYTYRACIPLLRQLIVPMTLNSSGIHDTARVLKISPTTVLSVLRRAASTVPEPRVPSRIKDLELDELWSFIGHKKHQCWLWLARNRRTGRIAAFELGRRTDRSCRRLIKKLARSQVQHFYTDDWKSYGKCLNPEQHHIGKSGTQGTERCNLNFRTHLKRLQRRTICFSRSPQMHHCVIKLYVHYLNSKQTHF